LPRHRAVGLHPRAAGLPRRRGAPRRDAGEHPLEHYVSEPVTRSEVRVGSQLDLALTVGRPGPRAAHRNTPATERDLTCFVAVAHSRALGEMLALRADDLIDLGLD